MNVEQSEWERRAAWHAALADPTRLRVLDLLALGDLSPSELQDALGVPSNLLAHHLKLLSDHGMVTRRRSEGDARRSYVHRTPAGAIQPSGGPATLRPERVVFVCRANSARSQLAEALWRQRSDVAVASAGTHPADRIEPGAMHTAERHGLPLTSHRPQAVTAVLAPGDLVVAVCDDAREEIGARADLHWSIPDPVPAGTEAAFEDAFSQIEDRVTRLAHRISAAA